MTLSHDPEGALDQGLADDLFSSFQTHIVPIIATAYTFQSVHVLARQDSVNLLAFDSTNAPVNGGNSAGSVANLGAPQVAMLVRKRTSFAGKAQRGRMYVPGIPETVIDSQGKIAGTTLTNAQVAFDAWHANLTTFAQPMLAHSCFHEVDQPPCTPIVWSQVISFEVDDTVATQRRRLAR